MSSKADLGKDSIQSLFFHYYFPALTSMLSITLHQIVNSLVLARYVGKEGVTAVGLFAPVLFVFIAVALALIIGGGILISRSIGARDYQQAQQVFQFSTTMALCVGAFIVISAPFISHPLASLLTGDDSAMMFQNTHDYLFYALLWIPLFILRMVWGNCITHDNGPKISRNANLLAVILNIVFDILLIIVFPLGTAGASLATGFAILISLMYQLNYLVRGKSPHLTFKNFKFTLYLKNWKELINYGVPSLISELSFSLGLILINRSLIHYGPLAVAAFGIINHLSFIFIRFLTAAIVSVLPIMSFNIGARLPERVFETLRFALVFTLAIGTTVTFIGFVFSQPLVFLFSNERSGNFSELAVGAVGLYFILFTAAGPNYIFAAYFQSIGKTSAAIGINLLKGFLLVAFFLLTLQDFHLTGVWLSRGLAEIATLIITVITLLIFKKQLLSLDSVGS